jgi:hypothetical protein
VTSQTFTVNVNGDTTFEPNETFFVNLTAASNATISDSQGLGTITNDDGVPGVSINDVSVTEGDSGSVNATFTVTLSSASGATVTVNFATADGTAVQPGDYTGTTGTLTFAPGTLTQSVTVAVTGDTMSETDETFLVNLSAPSNAFLADAQGVGTITNNDPPPTITISDVVAVEGQNAVFTVTLSAASGQTITVNYTTADGSATAGEDYVATSGTLTFPPGTTTLTISVPLIRDSNNVEPPETFSLILSGSANATIVNGTVTGTINAAADIPALDPFMLMLLAVALTAGAFVTMKRS